MKQVRYIAIALLLVAILVLGPLVWQSLSSGESTSKAQSFDHIYTSWDTMEFDKCVAAWLIIRFVDKDARFVFYHQGSEIDQGIPFDVPGAAWSRKHLKCTSQCILESLDKPDPAIKKVVSITGKTELNFWQLDRWPEAQKYFYELKAIIDKNPEPNECFQKAFLYLDKLYSDFKKTDFADSDI